MIPIVKIRVKSVKSKIYTSKKAAEIINVTTRTIQIWAESGIIPSTKTAGGHRRYSEVDIMKIKEKLKKGKTEKSSECNLKILIIEDTRTLLDLYYIQMKRWEMPIDIELSSDGYEGMLKIGVFKPDLIVLDLSLPNIDGFEILRSINESILFEEIKVVVVSGLPIEEIKRKISGYKIEAIYNKPIPFNELKAITKKIVESKRNISD